jgi:hypothetical protein
MKTTIFASLIASAAAFAPSSQPQPVSVTALPATAAELDAMPGKSIECGGKLVRTGGLHIHVSIHIPCPMILLYSHASLYLSLALRHLHDVFGGLYFL